MPTSEPAGNGSRSDRTEAPAGQPTSRGTGTKPGAPAAGHIVVSDFQPAWWLPGPHLQTLWPNLVRRPQRPPLCRERLELPDGDFLDLDWTPPRADRPLILILHGLQGSVHSPYASGILHALHSNGMRAVLMHFRGCSGEPNRRSRTYHSGETGDLAHVVAQLRKRHPHAPLGAVGYSLGGNVLLKWLGETGGDNPLARAVAVSVPLQLERAADRLEHGASRLYQAHLLRSLRRAMRRKYRTGTHIPPVALHTLRQLRTFRAFDDAVTAPLHDFEDANDYYARCSSRPFLAGIRIPTLILQAADDPFLTSDALPDETELSPCVTMELSPHGGHVGFVGGRWPWRAHYWLDERITKYLRPLMTRTLNATPRAVPR